MWKQPFTKLRWTIIAASMSLSVLSIPWAVDAVNAFADDKAHKQKNVNVQLLGINDFHGQLDTYDKKLNAGGAEYLAAYLKKREAANPKNTLMVHAGDEVGASSPVSALLEDEPTIEFLNHTGFDVGTVGNHEFDEGVGEMLRLINGGSNPKTVDKYGKFEGANFPYVAANVIDKKTNKPLLPPYVIKKVGGVPIGFIGIALSDTPSVVMPGGTDGVRFTDETKAINKYAGKLKAKGIKSIVVLAHNPATSNEDGSKASGELVDIAKGADDEVDVLFGGHNHALTNTTVDHKLLVESYSYGTAFSDVHLVINPVTKDIFKKKAEIVITHRDKIKPDAKTKKMVDNYTADVAPILSQKIGKASSPISKQQNANGESPLGNMIADAMRAQTHTEFAFMNPGGIRADIDAGEILWKEIFTAQPFGNDLVKMELTGDQVKQLLNQQWADPEKTNILQISGLNVKYVDSRREGDRIVEATLPDGTAIVPSKTYTATVNSFMASGGDGFTALKDGKNKMVDIPDLDALINYIKSKGEVYPAIEGRITKLSK
ncbi:bifunctional metallophosphatase/5'-nucleotidase [Fictibacillus sp. FJAT-27399]|uniref:bifunctional metallophosphatase/5'-nucleotidase n=1 Tax=Fictibacillus sp. FJAT-27399 TaxID=1729689 RepID=UPI000783EE6B|nr:5'-nucleotidase C-terminal domain-containing protein [Fictibacillus sp. FJAT-27399]